MTPSLVILRWNKSLTTEGHKSTEGREKEKGNKKGNKKKALTTDYTDG